jgi:hypothetical protein
MEMTKITVQIVELEPGRFSANVARTDALGEGETPAEAVIDLFQFNCPEEHINEAAGYEEEENG